MSAARYSISALAATLLAALAMVAAHADTPSFEGELLSIQQAWADANYRTPEGEMRSHALDALSQRATDFSKRYPNRAEPLVWEGIVLSTYAGAKGGLGALGLARRARDKLQAALQIDPNTLDGSAYTSLATLYHKVPGFPLAFGDDDKARDYFQRALKLNPDGIDPNYFYGEFLFDKKNYPDAVRHLQKALAAAPRKNREVADEGRRREVNDLLAKARQKMG